MATFTMFILVGSVLLNAVAQLLLKQGSKVLVNNGADGYSLASLGALIVNIPILGGLFCYGVSVLLWIHILSKVEVSRAYPMLSIGFIFNLFAAWIFFGEVISLNKLLGIILIVAGIWILSQ